LGASTARPGRGGELPGLVRAEGPVVCRIGVTMITLLSLGLAASPMARVGQAQGVTFTKEYLGDAGRIELGRKVWVNRCQFCHGKAAYPGKAPKLDPSRYTPEFVFDRVTNGFQGMPGWKHEFSEDERRAVVAYVMSKDFSN
jgi:mono/diheme cytochrome c family protein